MFLLDLHVVFVFLGIFGPAFVFTVYLLQLLAIHTLFCLRSSSEEAVLLENRTFVTEIHTKPRPPYFFTKKECFKYGKA